MLGVGVGRWAVAGEKMDGSKEFGAWRLKENGFSF